MRKSLVAGNWKMNGAVASLDQVSKIDQANNTINCQLALCLPSTLIHYALKNYVRNGLMLGGQDCHWKSQGAFTGDISAKMLRDIGASLVIVGHSERRTLHRESDNQIQKKAAAAIAEGLITIICLGETIAQKEKGQTEEVVCEQLRKSLPESASYSQTVIAYEPIWAIGSGLTPTVEEITKVHQTLRAQLTDLTDLDCSKRLRIIYGGSVKPHNAKEIFSIDDVDGALVGGASLTAKDFLEIATAT